MWELKKSRLIIYDIDKIALKALISAAAAVLKRIKKLEALD